MKDYLKELLSFSRKELNGILVLCGILFLLILSRPLIAWLAPTPRASIPKEEVTRFLIETAKPEGSGEDASAKIRTRKWAATDHHQGNTWEPAGRKVREDRSGAKMPETNWKRGKSRQKSWSGDSCSTVEINTADSAAFIPLRGIGPVLSARIVKYRERLGGFHVVEQLLEVYGMDTIAFRNFRSCLRVDRSLVEMIDLNRAGYRELRRLPYWSSSQIKVVLNYREQHGPYPDSEALYDIQVLDKSIIQKVIPYLMVNQNQSKNE